MSGHSKWANIKNRKGAQDKKRSMAFTKASKDILTALRAGGGSALQNAIDKARAVNMPKENIDRLIQKFESRKGNTVGGLLEGFGPGGVPIVVEIETDNKNRTLGEIRLIFKENDGSLGEEGSVGFLFDRVGEIETVNLSQEEALQLIDEGAIEFEENVVFTAPENLKKVEVKMREMGKEIVESKLAMRPKSPIKMENEDQVARILDLIDALEENDDVLNVFAGFTYEK